jgi:hypothetical protein
MRTESRRQLSSVFDDMLARNRERLGTLQAHGRSGSTVERNAASAAIPPPPPASEAVRRINDRFGDRWRHDVVERRREGDEAIVLVRLTLPDRGVVKTGFGHARIGGAVAGASGSLRFTLGSGPTGEDEADAYRRATEAALAKCLELLG